eukprot:TRINITY_DN9760_c0_g1_i5.p1 TRINITY_DN9760_c0_g1~~TRINITY_DN9760_c0_g1_i5.p1  ORF type:complete len:302 (-),score=83.53 TRINITY_DN9760_c0_g1_i5:178-951(-)
MKAIFYLLILELVACDRKYFTYKSGTLKNEKDVIHEIFGHIEIMNEGNTKYIELNGLQLSTPRIPFALIFDLPTVSGNKATGLCRSGRWDLGSMKLTGKYTFEIKENAITFESTCLDRLHGKIYDINFTGNSTKCLVFQPPEPSHRVQYLIGERTSRFRPAYVLNFAYYDYPFMNILRNCRFYLNKFGSTASDPKPGYAIVGNDGMHCGVVDHEGTKFIHANPAKKTVTLTPLALARTFFRNGYVFKSVPCKGPHGY